ncbi:MAG TPA: phosphatase domain-containing protein [Geminicoccus sp.]|nr:phosphatase domain-containing protein [Geminicoccus sp.]HEX2529512.1 phosphatase domain-containing protein [Geminicoccus sp.]
MARILHLIGRPARTAQGRRGVVIEPYRGYGSREEIFLIGRVFWQSAADRDGRADDLIDDLRDIGRRIVRRAVRGATVTACFYDTEEQVTTDRDGYFRIHLKPDAPPPASRSWHRIALRLDEPRRVRAQGQVFIPPDHCRFVVISDIDDTIMHTGVANRLKMLWRLFVQDAERRTAFPGVAALYRALHGGWTGHEGNPLLYVSRAPWGIYGVLDEFFRLHRIPIGPILFLREWGVSWSWPLPRKAEDHKRDLIRNMLSLYRDLPFVLIGDSGQHDPEVYRQIVVDHPGRVAAVYIRNVSRDRCRIREIEQLAAAVTEAGSTLVLAADSLAIARHAASMGLLPPTAIADVQAERRSEMATDAPDPYQAEGSTVDDTADALLQGRLERILDEGPGETPPNVIIEPSRQKRD